MKILLSIRPPIPTSELLGQYIRSDCHRGANDKPYTQVIQHSYLTALQAGKSENDINGAIREAVNDYSGKGGKGFRPTK